MIFFSVFAYHAVDKIDLALFAFFQILQHAGNELAVLFHRDGDQGKRNLLFQPTAVIEQLVDFMPLHRLDADIGRFGDVDTFFDDALGDTARAFEFGNFAEGGTRDSGKPRKCALAEQLRPPRAEKLFIHRDRAHTFEQRPDIVQMIPLAVSAEGKGERRGI